MSSFMKMYLGDPGGPYDPPPGAPEDDSLADLEARVQQVEDTVVEARDGLDYARQLRHARVELYIAVAALAILGGALGGCLVLVLARTV